jgi:hypothetical protein
MLPRLIHLLARCSFLVFPTDAAFAQERVTADGFAYEVAGGVATITDYRGSATAVVVPGMIGSVPVRRIADRVFEGVTGLASVVISEGIVSIGGYAFGGCSSLTSVSLPASLTQLDSPVFPATGALRSFTVAAGNAAFITAESGRVLLSADRRTLVALAGATAGDWVVPDGVQIIAPGALFGCASIRSLSLPESVTTIEHLAFVRMAQLREFRLPAGVNRVGAGILASCASLVALSVDPRNPAYVATPDGRAILTRDGTQLVQYASGRQGAYEIPSTVTTIALTAFSGSAQLTAVALSEGLRIISGWAFEGCGNLGAMTFPASLQRIDNNVFSNARKLESLHFRGPPPAVGAQAFEFTAIREVTYRAGVPGWGSSWNSWTTVAVSAPAIIRQPTARQVVAGGTLSLEVTATGGALLYEWYQNGRAVTGASPGAALTIRNISPIHAGTYHVVVSNPEGKVQSGSVPIVVYPGQRLSNLSIRAALEGSQSLIVGAVVAAGEQEILMRAAGPALDGFGLPGMPDPRLEVYAGGASPVAGNNDWSAALAPLFARVGAFAFPGGSRDSALAWRATGAFTAQTRGDQGGVVLVEAYATDAASPARLVNLSARGRVGSGADILIAGFAIAGSGSKALLLRAVGPGLERFGVTGVLQDPRLQVLDGSGAIVSANDNWEAALSVTFNQVGAFPLVSGSRDAALLVSLPSGAAYTVQVSGNAGTPGEALVEIYEVF